MTGEAVLIDYTLVEVDSRLREKPLKAAHLMGMRVLGKNSEA